jgi:hypothetical protein
MSEKYLFSFGRLSRTEIADGVRPGTILQGRRDRQRIFFREYTGETEKRGDESKWQGFYTISPECFPLHETVNETRMSTL